MSAQRQKPFKKLKNSELNKVMTVKEIINVYILLQTMLPKRRCS